MPQEPSPPARMTSPPLEDLPLSEEVRERLRPYVDVEKTLRPGFEAWLLSILPLLPRPAESEEAPFPSSGDEAPSRLRELARALSDCARRSSQAHFQASLYFQENRALALRVQGLLAVLRTAQSTGRVPNIILEPEPAADRYLGSLGPEERDGPSGTTSETPTPEMSGTPGAPLREDPVLPALAKISLPSPYLRTVGSIASVALQSLTELRERILQEQLVAARGDRPDLLRKLELLEKEWAGLLPDPADSLTRFGRFVRATMEYLSVLEEEIDPRRLERTHGDPLPPSAVRDLLRRREALTHRREELSALLP